MAEAELKGMLGFSVVSTNDGIQVSSAASNEALFRHGSMRIQRQECILSRPKKERFSSEATTFSFVKNSQLGACLLHVTSKGGRVPAWHVWFGRGASFPQPQANLQPTPHVVSN